MFRKLVLSAVATLTLAVPLAFTPAASADDLSPVSFDRRRDYTSRYPNGVSFGLSWGRDYRHDFHRYYTVFYRASPWHQWRVYETFQSHHQADRAAHRLHHLGYETFIRSR